MAPIRLSLTRMGLQQATATLAVVPTEDWESGSDGKPRGAFGSTQESAA